MINVWKETPHSTLEFMTRCNTYFAFLIDSFKKVQEGTQTWEWARDHTRSYLTSNAMGRRVFGFHRTRVAVTELMEAMLTLSSPVMYTTWTFHQCNTIVQQQPSNSLVWHCLFYTWQELALETNQYVPSQTMLRPCSEELSCFQCVFFQPCVIHSITIFNATLWHWPC